jgi:hypothetical protein
VAGASAKAPKERGRRIRCRATGMANQRQIEIVAKQRFLAKLFAILCVKSGGKGRSEDTVRVDRRPAAHQVGPEREVRIRNIAQGEIQLAMKIVQIRSLGGLERGPVDPDHREQGSCCKTDHRICDMPAERQVDIGLDLPGFKRRVTHNRGPLFDIAGRP